MSDDIESEIRDFQTDPSLQKLKKLLYISKRYGFNIYGLPEDANGILNIMNRIDDIMYYLKNMSFGDPCNIIVDLFAIKGFISYTKTLNFIGEASVGDPSSAAFRILFKRLSRDLFANCGYNFEEDLQLWVEYIIRNDKIGSAPQRSVDMVRHYDSSVEWAESVIERAVSGNPPEAAYEMSLTFGSEVEWLMNIIELSPCGEKAKYAVLTYLSAKDSAEFKNEIKKSWVFNVIDSDKSIDQEERDRLIRSVKYS